MVQKDLLLLPTNQLLAEFGSGKPSPGSGSAAALSGLLACKLCHTVILLTVQRTSQQKDHAELLLLKNSLDEIVEPELTRLFQRDSEIFEEVIALRRLRDAATDPQKRRAFSE